MPDPALDDFDLLTGDAARLLDSGSEAVRAHERAGRLHPRRTARGIRLFSRREVEALAAARAQRRVTKSAAATTSPESDAAA